jgi:hypothetical protein
MFQCRGYCVATDPAGDQIVADVASDGKFRADAKSYEGRGRLATGTGKYAGVGDDYTAVFHLPEFRTAAVGTCARYGAPQGGYNLP